MLTIKEVAERYGVCRLTVEAWIAQGELGAVNVARNTAGRKRYRITPEALTAFDASRSTTRTARIPTISGEFEQFI